MNDKAPLEIKDLFHMERMERPTCGRDDCNCEKCPEHWVAVHPGPVLLALIHAAREAFTKLHHAQNEREPVAWPETRALEDALRPFEDMAEQEPAPKGEMDFAPARTPEEKRIQGYRWQVSVTLAGDPNGARITLAGFANQADAEHWAEMIDENPEYESVEVDETFMQSAPPSASA